MLGAGLVAAPASAQERGRCARISVDWPVQLPDGSMHEARDLTLCLNDYWTPVSGLHEISVNGRAIGRFVSRVDFSESVADLSPVVVFERDITTNTHRLIGYAWPAGDRMRTFALGSGQGSRDRASAGLQAALLGPDLSRVAGRHYIVRRTTASGASRLSGRSRQKDAPPSAGPAGSPFVGHL